MVVTPQDPHDPDDVPSTGKRRKDRKTWCKGKHGRSHAYSPWEEIYGPLWKGGWALGRQVCEQCGRQEWSRRK